MRTTVPKNHSAVHVHLSDYLVLIYKQLAKTRHMSMAHVIEQALLRNLNEVSAEELEKKLDEKNDRESAILQYVQFLENKGMPPSVRDVSRYLKRYTVVQITEDMTRLVEQGRVEKHRGGKTYRYTVPK